MSTIMIRVPKDKTMELKGMIQEGLHIFGRAMSLAEQMCEGEIGERNYGMREGVYGMREYPEYPMMGERDGYGYGERRGVPGTGRYSRY